MKFLLPFSIFTAAFLLMAPVPAQAQQADPLPETKVVLRITRDFIQNLTGTQFQRGETIHTHASNTAISGHAHVDCSFEVKLHPSATESAFDLLVQGNFSTQLLASRHPVQISAHGLAPFSARRRIVFDGDAFTGGEIALSVDHHSSVDQISSARGGLIGRITRRAARSSVQRDLPETDRQISDEIRTRLSKALQEESDQRMVAMNTKIKQMVDEAEGLLRAEKLLPAGSTHRYFAATEQHLFMSIGPEGHRIPTLPALDHAKQAPVELWIAMNKGGMTTSLESWDLIKPMIYQRMAKQAPELAKLIEQVRVDSVRGWHVVTFAQKVL